MTTGPVCAPSNFSVRTSDRIGPDACEVVKTAAGWTPEFCLACAAVWDFGTIAGGLTSAQT
jgi:hypothetical protein